MKGRARRPYHQTKRAAGAASTRARIVRAARALFEGKGWFGVGVDDVAKRAGVGRATVFQVFGSKAGLLDAVAVSATESPEFGALLRALGDDDPARAVRKTIDAGCLFWEKTARLAGAMHMLAAIDRDVARSVAERERARAESIADLERRLAAAGKLRRGIGHRQATEVLVLATSFAAFDELRHERGLSLAETQRVLRSIAARALLAG